MKKAPSPLVSLIPLVVLVIMLFATIRTFGSDALSGGSQVSLLTTTAVCILIGMGFYKIGWKDFELAITNNITGVSTALIILLIIGALSGAWMISGVVPTLIYLLSNKPISRSIRHRGIQTESGISNRDIPLCLFPSFSQYRLYPIKKST